MSDKLRKAITLDRQQLRRLLEEYRPLLVRSGTKTPDQTGVAALSSVLHSFYNGVENVFKRIATDLDGEAPSGQYWHRRLLDSMRKPGTSRPAVLAPESAVRLDEYMQFRHVFRHSYTFDMDWASMKPLVVGLEETLRLFENDLDRFMQAIGTDKV